MDELDRNKLFSRLHEEYLPSNLARLMRHGASREMAQDASQQAMVELVQMINREGILPIHNYQALYFQISFRRLMDEFRRGVRFSPLEVDVEDLHEYEPVVSMSFHEQREVLQNLLKFYICFHNKYGRMFFEKFILKYSNAEIAARRGMTENSVGATLSTWMGVFKKWLKTPSRTATYTVLLSELQLVKGWWWEWRKEYPWNQ